MKSSGEWISVSFLTEISPFILLVTCKTFFVKRVRPLVLPLSYRLLTGEVRCNARLSWTSNERLLLSLDWLIRAITGIFP